MLFRVSVLLLITALLFVVSAANASPTVTRQDAILTTNLSPADTSTTTSNSIDNIVEPINAKLAALGAEFLQPPASFTALSGTQGNHVKPLPAVPAAILMVVMGFLCVSLVRDRRVWLTALAGLLWAGQTGIQVIPQLALRLSQRKHLKQESCAKFAYARQPENFSRLRSDLEGTQYIGLLRRLAGIPDAKSPSANSNLTALIALSQHEKLHDKAFSYPHKNTFPSASAIIPEQYSLNPLLYCLAAIAEQRIYFSPAFIFDNLPRGPPKSVRLGCFFI